MRRIGDLMKDLGFNKSASEETARAFIQHLVQAANVSQIQRKTKPSRAEPVQLSFPLEDLTFGNDRSVKEKKQTG